MSIELMPHNKKSYEGVIECYKKSNICCVIQPPSTRKTSIALKFIEDSKGKKTLYLAPGSAILHQVKELALDEGVYTAENFNRKTYQSLSKMSDEEIANLEVDIIILDEFHHCGSPVWGAAVRKLIETHPNAKVLGLSATPIRYFDGNIDMAEKLFNGNIASEISFDQAIEQEILEEFDYVAATYGIDFEKIITDEMLSDGYVPEQNKEVFNKLYEELKVKLGENVVNLPNVLERHIKQKNGKYVFFCKNIEDKEHQIKEVKRLFSKVNSNIKIYDIDYTHTDKENQRTIQSFRRATSDDGALKILFNVNMLVEGFHLPDLAGGFTTRPTKSPRIAIQEAGRILRVKEAPQKDIRPVFIDFVDTLRQLDIVRSAITSKKTNIKRARTEEENYSKEKIRIYDTTLEIAKIVDKMKSLVVERTTIEEKIMYIERYLKSKESSISGNVIDEEKRPISGNAIDENGKPIGFWGIQIRSAIKNGTVYDDSIIEKLRKLGILERQIDSTIDEKMDFMITFAKEYPELMREMSDTLGIRTSAINKIKDEYVLGQIEQFNKYYTYVARRLYDKKLSEDRFEILKKAGIGGQFNKYEDPLIDSDLKNAEKRTQKFVKDMIKKYGSMEEFEKHYIYELVNNPYFSKPSDYFIQSIDLASPNFVADPNYADFVAALYNGYGYTNEFNSYLVINSENVNDALELLREKQANVLKLSYGLQGNKKHKHAEISDELKLNVANNRVSQIRTTAGKMLQSVASKNKKEIFLNDNIGDLLYFLQDFIDIYGIRKRESITPEMKKEIMSMYEKQLRLKEEIKVRSLYVGKYATIEEKIQMLRNTFGDKINNDWIRNHFLASEDLSLEEGNKESQDEYYKTRIDRAFDVLLPMVVMDEKNRDYVERIKEKELIVNKLNKYFKYVSNEYSRYTRGDVDIYKIVTMPISSLEYEMCYMTKYIQEVQQILKKHNLHYGMSDEEIKMCVINHEKMLEGIKNIEDLNISEDSTRALSALGITTIEDFKAFGYNKLMQINSYVNESIDKSICQNIPIEELDISDRAFKCLNKAGIYNVDQLINMDEEQIMSIKNIGTKTYDEIQNQLELFTNQNSDVSNLQNIDEETKEAVEAVVEAFKGRGALWNIVYNVILEVSEKYRSLFDREILQDEGENDEEASEAKDADMQEDIDIDNITEKKNADEMLINLVNNIKCSYSQIQSKVQEISEIERAIDTQLEEAHKVLSEREEQRKALEKQKTENNESIDAAVCDLLEEEEL